jgi:hypothetical protein
MIKHRKMLLFVKLQKTIKTDHGPFRLRLSDEMLKTQCPEPKSQNASIIIQSSRKKFHQSQRGECTSFLISFLCSLSQDCKTESVRDRFAIILHIRNNVALTVRVSLLGEQLVSWRDNHRRRYEQGGFRYPFYRPQPIPPQLPRRGRARAVLPIRALTWSSTNPRILQTDVATRALFQSPALRLRARLRMRTMDVTIRDGRVITKTFSTIVRSWKERCVLYTRYMLYVCTHAWKWCKMRVCCKKLLRNFRESDWYPICQLITYTLRVNEYGIMISKLGWFIFRILDPCDGCFDCRSSPCTLVDEKKEESSLTIGNSTYRFSRCSRNDRVCTRKLDDKNLLLQVSIRRDTRSEIAWAASISWIKSSRCESLKDRDWRKINKSLFDQLTCASMRSAPWTSSEDRGGPSTNK